MKQTDLAEVAMNAARYVWLRENWRSEVDGERVPEWIGKLLLHYGGFDECVDVLMTASHDENWWIKRDWLAQPVTWNALTDEDRELAMRSMPDMLDGFMKTWGWLHFAKAIEAICREKNEANEQTQIVPLDGSGK